MSFWTRVPLARGTVLRFMMLGAAGREVLWCALCLKLRSGGTAKKHSVLSYSSGFAMNPPWGELGTGWQEERGTCSTQGACKRVPACSWVQVVPEEGLRHSEEEKPLCFPSSFPCPH